MKTYGVVVQVTVDEHRWPNELAVRELVETGLKLMSGVREAVVDPDDEDACQVIE